MSWTGVLRNRIVCQNIRTTPRSCFNGSPARFSHLASPACRPAYPRKTHSLARHLDAHVQVPLRQPKAQVISGFRVASAVGLGFGLGLTATYLGQGSLYFEPGSDTATAPQANTNTNANANTNPAVPPNAYDPNQPLPSSKGLANPYELTFGTMCGICAGVFVKKGLKAAAFILGGAFVVLQYFNSLSWIRVDWVSAESRFKRTFYTTTDNGQSRPPTVQLFFTWLVNFVMADFQPRASFIAGLLLGLRVG